MLSLTGLVRTFCPQLRPSENPLPPPYKQGFTLAEVLITLVIIGVIAALTVPNMIKDYRNQEYTAKFKKAYTTISNAFRLSQAQNGPLTSWDIANEQYNCIDKYIIPYLQVNKNCKMEVNSGCITHKWYFANGNLWQNPDTNSGEYRFVLSDGMQYSIYIRTNCIENKTECFDIHIDTNGKKGPNKRGVDLFSFYAYPFTNDVVPGGARSGADVITYDSETKKWSQMTREEIEETCANSGWSCGAKVIMNGYKIDI